MAYLKASGKVTTSDDDGHAPSEEAEETEDEQKDNESEIAADGTGIISGEAGKGGDEDDCEGEHEANAVFVHGLGAALDDRRGITLNDRRQ